MKALCEKHGFTTIESTNDEPAYAELELRATTIFPGAM
jgi:hypothetical protein